MSKEVVVGSRIVRLTGRLAVAVLVVTLAGCAGNGGDATPATKTAPTGDKAEQGSDKAEQGGGQPAAPAGRDAAELGKTWCERIRSVQADLRPNAASAAYLAQLVLAGDPEETAKLSAAVVDAATKKECPKEYAKILEQAEITSLVDVGMRP